MRKWRRSRSKRRNGGGERSKEKEEDDEVEAEEEGAGEEERSETGQKFCEGGQVGVPENRLRKWTLTIASYLRSQNGTLADAMLMWRANCAREFAGMEECLICYAIVSPVNRELPRQTCRQCGKCFHGTCLYKWFRSAGKSNCPHCQGQW